MRTKQRKLRNIIHIKYVNYLRQRSDVGPLLEAGMGGISVSFKTSANISIR